jgi:hypothetical protein
MPAAHQRARQSPGVRPRGRGSPHPPHSVNRTSAVAGAYDTSTMSSHSSPNGGTASCTSTVTCTSTWFGTTVRNSAPGTAAPHSPLAWPAKASSGSGISSLLCTNAWQYHTPIVPA